MGQFRYLQLVSNSLAVLGRHVTPYSAVLCSSLNVETLSSFDKTALTATATVYKLAVASCFVTPSLVEAPASSPSKASDWCLKTETSCERLGRIWTSNLRNTALLCKIVRAVYKVATVVTVFPLTCQLSGKFSVIQRRRLNAGAQKCKCNSDPDGTRMYRGTGSDSDMSFMFTLSALHQLKLFPSAREVHQPFFEFSNLKLAYELWCKSWRKLIRIASLNFLKSECESKETVTHQEAEIQKSSDGGNIYDVALSKQKTTSHRYICPQKSHISHFPHVAFWDAWKHQ